MKVDISFQIDNLNDPPKTGRIMKIFMDNVTRIVILIGVISVNGISQNSTGENYDKSIHLINAEKAKLKGDCKLAIRYINELFEQRSLDSRDRIKGHLLMGQCLEEGKKYSEAKYHYKMALRLGFKPGAALTGTFLQAKEEKEIYDYALNQYKLADPQRSNTEIEKMKYAMARNMAMTLSQRQPYSKDQAFPKLLLGAIEVDLKNEPEAKKYFNQLLKLDNNFEIEGEEEFTIRSGAQELFRTTKASFIPLEPPPGKPFWKKALPYGGAAVVGLAIGIGVVSLVF